MKNKLKCELEIRTPTVWRMSMKFMSCQTVHFFVRDGNIKNDTLHTP